MAHWGDSVAHSALRTVTTIAAATALAAVTLTSGHAAQADPSSGRADSAVRSQAQVGPRNFVDDPDTYFFYATSQTTSDCGGNPACDIAFSQYYVQKSSPTELLVITEVEGQTDASMSDNDTGGIITFFDSDGDPNDWDYRVWTAYRDYPLGEWIESTVEEWNGDEWVETGESGYYIRRATYWAMSLEYAELGIETASMAVKAIDADGNEDMSPGSFGTPYIPIAAMVAGAPGQPQNPTATPTDTGDVDVTWTAPVNSGASAITSYEVTASPGGRNCTTGGLDCTITGLTPGTEYFFTVRAINAQGAGLPSDVVAATPKSLAPAMPMIKSKVKIKKTGKTASITTFWTKPAGATSFEIRWTLANKKWTPWKSTKATKATVKGIAWKTGRSFEVRALNSYGTSPADMRVLYYGPNEGR